MIDWLNTNEGFVLGVLTFVYVMATIILVAAGLWQTHLTRLALKKSDESESRRYRPYVIFDMYSENVAVYASIKNIGASPALNVNLQVSPELQRDLAGEDQICPLQGNSVSFLAPKREIRDICGFGQVFNEKYPKQIFTGRVAYQDSDGNEYSEEFHIDLRAQRLTTYVAKKEPARELEKIAESLKTITSSNFKPLFRIMREEDYQKQQEDLIAEITRRTQARKEDSNKESDPT
jgi:hypothetical protein